MLIIHAPDPHTPLLDSGLVDWLAVPGEEGTHSVGVARLHCPWIPDFDVVGSRGICSHCNVGGSHPGRPQDGLGDWAGFPGGIPISFGKDSRKVSGGARLAFFSLRTMKPRSFKRRSEPAFSRLSQAVLSGACCHTAASAEVNPQARKIDWADSAGIPNRTTTYTNLPAGSSAATIESGIT
jgi:hypothetical protein